MNNTMFYDLELDIRKYNRVFCLAKQGDHKSRFIHATILNDGKKINVSQDSTVVINAIRADKQQNSYVGEVKEDGTVIVPISNWMLALDETVKVDISIIGKDNSILTTLGFEILVEANAGSGVEGKDESKEFIIKLMEDTKNANETSKKNLDEVKKTVKDAKDIKQGLDGIVERFDNELKNFKGVRKVNNQLPDEEGNVNVKTSQLENDKGYLTKNELPKNVSSFKNDVNYQKLVVEKTITLTASGWDENGVYTVNDSNITNTSHQEFSPVKVSNPPSTQDKEYLKFVNKLQFADAGQTDGQCLIYAEKKPDKEVQLTMRITK